MGTQAIDQSLQSSPGTAGHRDPPDVAIHPDGYRAGQEASADFRSSSTTLQVLMTISEVLNRRRETPAVVSCLVLHCSAWLVACGWSSSACSPSLSKQEMRIAKLCGASGWFEAQRPPMLLDSVAFPSIPIKTHKVLLQPTCLSAHLQQTQLLSRRLIIKSFPS